MLKTGLLLIFVLLFALDALSQLNNPTKKLGLSPSFLWHFSKNINQDVPSIGSFAIYRRDSIVYEKYFHDGTDTTLFNVKSITKSILSALAGIAKEKSLLPDLSTPVLDILSKYKPQAYRANVWFAETRLQNDTIRQRVTLRDVLTMQMGLQWDDFGPVATAYVLSSDPVRFVLDLPLDISLHSLPIISVHSLPVIRLIL
jgi:hypothetical protein